MATLPRREEKLPFQYAPVNSFLLLYRAVRQRHRISHDKLQGHNATHTYLGPTLKTPWHQAYDLGCTAHRAKLNSSGGDDPNRTKQVIERG